MRITQGSKKNLSAISHQILGMLQIMDEFVEAKEREKRALGATEFGTAIPGSALHKPRHLQKSNFQEMQRPKRFNFKGKALLAKNQRYIKGTVLNISRSVIFIQADVQVFRPNEEVRLFIKPEGMKKYFKAIATVIRFNDDHRQAVGYGLQFVFPHS